MPRPPRIDREDGLYHVTSRGNARGAIYRSAADRERFLAQLADNLDAYDCRLCAYVLMDNHFHLLVRTPRANLSRFMQRLVTSYALYARYKHKSAGHIFQGRFKAKLVESERYLRQVSRYLHLNPVRTKQRERLPPGELRTFLDGYRWSSYRAYAGLAPREEFVEYATILRSFQAPDRPASAHATRGPQTAEVRYRRYVMECLEATDEETLTAMRQSGYAIGSDGFVEALETELAGRRQGDPRDQDVALPRARVDIGRIDEEVSRAFGVPAAELAKHGRAAGVGLAKAVAAELARRLTGMTQRAIGVHYGVTSQAVAMMGVKVRRQTESDSSFRSAVERLSCRILS